MQTSHRQIKQTPRSWASMVLPHDNFWVGWKVECSFDKNVSKMHVS